MNVSKILSQILLEQEISFDEFTTYKVSIHKAFLENWLLKENSNYSLSKIWQIREQCITDLQGN